MKVAFEHSSNWSLLTATQGQSGLNVTTMKVDGVLDYSKGAILFGTDKET